MTQHEKYIEQIKKDFPKIEVKLSQPFEVIENAEHYEKEYEKSLFSWSKDNLFCAFYRSGVLIVYGVSKGFDLTAYIENKNANLITNEVPF